MKRSKWIRFLALALLLAMAVGAIPAAMATEDSAVEQTVPDSVSDEPLEVEPETTAAVSPEPEPTPSKQPPAAEEVQAETEEPAEDQEPTDMNGETLTRHAISTGGPRRARAASYGTVGKSTCVDFAGYTSPYWYCNRYATQGTHVYGHYYYCSTIAYHTVDGDWAYCIEPNTSSVGGQTYYSYDGNSAASDSYWMLELDSWQRYYIQQIMAFGYPSIDRGYSVQAQYAATQTLIWEVVSKCRYGGYKVLSSQSVTVYEGSSSTVTFTNQPLKGNLTVNKSVNYGTKAGFKFRLYGTSTIGKSVDVTATTNSSGKATFSNIYVGTYTLEEVDPGNAYIKPSSKTVTISANATTGAAYTTTASMTNTWKYWRASVTKVDAETGTPQGDASLEGAEYTLYKSGTAVKTYTVKNGSFVTDLYPCTDSDSVYTLKETKAPPGYALDETVYKLTTGYSHYSNAENAFNVTVSDQVIQGTIQLDKRAVNTVSGVKQPEQGATFQVWLKSAGSYEKAKAAERDVIIIGEDGKGASKNLPYGVYCIRQISGWEGYDMDETIYEAAITTQGETVTKDVNKDDLAIENNIWLGTLSILKVDGDTREPLAGAEFTLTGSDGSKVTLETDSAGKAEFSDLVYGVDYTWTETKAPKGYLLDEANTGTWSVTKHDDSVEITCEDYRRPGSITVTKQNADSEPLPGAVFLLEYWDGSAWKPVTGRSNDVVTIGACTSEGLTDGQLTTDESGKVIFEGLWADDQLQYRLTEVKAPEGYEFLAEPVFEGVLPVSYNAEKVSAEPEEIIGGTAYFYNPTFTVTNGHVYEMPMTGGRNLPLTPIGAVMILLSTFPIILYFTKRRTIA